MQYAGGPIYRLPNEILHNIVECIYEPYFDGLNRLFPALINKTFNEIATPYLWKSLRPQYGKDLRACLEVLARSKRLAGFVEMLAVEIDQDWLVKPTNVPALCALLAQALPNMRRLAVLDMQWIHWYTSPVVLAALCAKYTSTLQLLTINSLRGCRRRPRVPARNKPSRGQPAHTLPYLRCTS
ncbi:hypothetical protein NM688_g1514 [Phlebia brevispora]|uniref:Uncharacterized protein n=1 Tax=Phlebia brevispora TaxID=194682 RepID=A0ACC1TBK5_9APHY|nr:hypothetical protein NM688_g1514 [Phlebia brevispora]